MTNVIEGIALLDNREQVWEETARNWVESTSECEWDEIPEEARATLIDWVRQWWEWMVLGVSYSMTHPPT